MPTTSAIETVAANASASRRLRIAFVHPDLGIGGAERLVLDAAIGLQNKGHHVDIYTSHCDPKHCFDEVKDRKVHVVVAGDWLPRSILGRFMILCAILRQLVLSLYITLFCPDYDVVFVDQLSACIPIIRYKRNVRVMMYCHFPDKYLSPRTSWLKQVYRVPFDWIEGWTTGMADCLVVNSKFTASVVASAFPRLHGVPRVVYPAVDIAPPRQHGDIFALTRFLKNRRVILSINRFERKKNIQLAVDAFARLKSEPKFSESVLVLAGGYDMRVEENVLYHHELERACATHGLSTWTSYPHDEDKTPSSRVNVIFALSISSGMRDELLHKARLLVYTPENEHFGIVPIEAMLAGTPVLAQNNGGPMESVVDGETGWLRAADPQAWADVMRHGILPADSAELEAMGAAGRQRVVSLFSLQAMADSLEACMREMLAPAKQEQGELFLAFVAPLLLAGLLYMLARWLMAYISPVH